MPPVDFVTHARNVEELRTEFVSDIERRIQALSTTLRVMKPSAAEAARLGRAMNELQALQDFWIRIRIDAGGGT